MIAYLFVSIAALICLFALFLVLGRTLNNIINLLAKVEYLLNGAFEYSKERHEIRRMLASEVKEQAGEE